MPAFLDKTIVKVMLGIALLGMIFGMYKWWHGNVFDAGVNHQIAKQAKANEKADKKFTERLNLALTEAELEREKAAKLQNEINNIQRRYRDVSEAAKAAADSGCERIGDKSFILLNEIIGEAPDY